MTDDKTPRGDMLAEMVNRFLGWKLPEDFSPDCGISFKRRFNEHTAHPMKNEPIGTNLLDAIQTKAMLEHVAGPALTELQGALDSINEILIKHQGLLHDARRENAALRTQLEEARAEKDGLWSANLDMTAAIGHLSAEFGHPALEGDDPLPMLVVKYALDRLAAKDAEAEELRTSLQAALQQAEDNEQDAKTLNELGHALGRCYCTDSGCYTVEPHYLMERARELVAKEHLEWDYHAVCVERDALQARVNELAEAKDRLEEDRRLADVALANANGQIMDQNNEYRALQARVERLEGALKGSKRKPMTSARRLGTCQTSPAPLSTEGSSELFPKWKQLKIAQ
jgi:DNA repair exonuclease SbcCD ATPase subunit